MITSLSGIRPGHALFTCDARAVVIDLGALTASATFPEYEIIPAQWDEMPDPSTIPTQAFTLADDAFSDVVVINASGKRAGKRTYAVPKNVRDTATRALTAGGGTMIEQSVATHLASGKPVSYDTVRHVNMYFEHADLTGLTASVTRNLWGGDAGESWSAKIVFKEVALQAAAAAPHDLQLTGRGAMNPRPNTETIEDDPGPELPWGQVDATERHVFVPLSIVNPWDCEYCFGPEGALIHTNSMREQVINNYGDPSDELAQYDEYLAQFDAPSIESEKNAPMAASGLLRENTEPEIETAPAVDPVLASAFFTDELPGDQCDYHAEYDDEARSIAKVYVRAPDDAWRQWNHETISWDDAGDASDVGLEPIDPNSAYVVAMKQSQNGGGGVPVHDVHPMEWATADAAADDVADEVDAFDEAEPEFFVQTANEDETQVQGLYAQREGLWFRWDGDEWIAVPAPTSVSQVDEGDAEQISRWLTWANDGTDPGDAPITAALPKTKNRAGRANQPGQVNKSSSRVPGSARSPYTSRSTAPGSSWFRKPGQASPNYAPGRYGPSQPASGAAGYTPEERSQNASKQVRDGYGRFATGGSTIDTKAGTGTITKVDPTTQQIQVTFADGSSTWVNARDTRVHGADEPAAGETNPASQYRTSNDKGEVWLPAAGPRATKYTAKAHLGKLQPILTSEQLTKMLDDASAYFARERANAKKTNPAWNSTRAVTASANHDGVMVAFFLDPETAQQFAVPGGEPPESLHMTLAYLGNQDEAGVDAEELTQLVRQWADRTPPIAGEISGHGVFTNGEKPVTHMSVDCPDLPAARQSLIDHLQANGLSPRMDHGFDPHITLAYNDTPVDVPATPVSFSHVTVSHGPDDTPIPLGGNAAMSAAAPIPAAGLTPDTSDVEPLHLAIVDPVDKSAVMELLDLVPASATSTEPVLFKRTEKGWERDDNMMMTLRGATPPPVVTLDAQTFPSVLSQVDETLAKPQDAPVAASADIDLYNEFGELFPALTAVAGQEVTPKDALAAERLRKYWTFGPGGAKIRWGQGGDFNRCRQHLTKYLGPRSAGYCQKLHHRVLGFYTGTHAKMLRGGKHGVRGSGILAFRLASADVLPLANATVASASRAEDHGLALIVTPLTDAIRSSFSGVRAPDVLSVGDRFEMLGPEAVTYAAEVVDFEAVRDRTEREFVGQLVRTSDSPVQALNASVTLLIERSDEEKAS